MTNECSMTNDQSCNHQGAPDRLKPGLQTWELVIEAWSFIGHWSLVIGHCFRSLVIGHYSSLILTALTLIIPSAFAQTPARPPVTVPPAAPNQDMFNALIGSAA